MKVIIGYDGSACSDAALDDLKMAGLPDEAVEVVIVSVAEIWLPSPENKDAPCCDDHLQSPLKPYKTHENTCKDITEVETLAKHARDRLIRNFPGWQISAKANFGSPAGEILSEADSLKADLIVVGSHGRSAIGRFFLGSISSKILSEANCSVRIARGKIEVDPIPSRIVIGYDGTPGANAAVEAVAARNWREQSEFRLLVATNSLVPTAIGRFVPPITNWVEDEMRFENEWIENLAEKPLRILNDAGCAAALQIRVGNPKQILIAEAETWHADSIFVGANRFGSYIEKFLLGSVSAAVAARAACSVEVVRKK